MTGGAVGKHDLAWMRRNLPGRRQRLARTTARRGCAASACGGRGRASSCSRSAEDDVSQRGVPVHDRARLPHRLRAGPRRCGSPTSASSAGRSTRRPSSARSCGTRCGAAGRGARRGRVRRRAPTTRCGSRRATASGARTSTRSTTPTRPASAGAVRLKQGADFIGRDAAARDQGARRRRASCAAWSPTTRRVVLVGKEPILDGDARARVRDERRLRRDGRGEHPLRLPARRSTPRPGTTLERPGRGRARTR